MTNQFERQLASPGEAGSENLDRKTDMAETPKKQEFREAKEALQKNDITVTEGYAGLAKDALHRAGFVFDVKLHLEKGLTKEGHGLPREFIFRFGEQNDEKAKQAFETLKQLNLDVHIVSKTIDLDKEQDKKDE
ncbi:MAG: hypothetical protein Q7R79_01150 [bacterium]|nr:hypothetical protein [bacterium]